MTFNSGRTTAKRFSRALRKNQTEPEAILWSRLRNRKLAGIKFQRQVPIQGYVADFAALSAHIAIELDGGQHSERNTYDDARTKVFEESAGFLVLRFWNSQVREDLDGVLESIRATMRPDEYSAPP
jgi:crossover junction endodeoxyribonuclease RuvC